MARPRTLVIGLIVLGGTALYVASLSNYLPPQPSAIPPESQWPQGPRAAGCMRVDAQGVEQVWVSAGWFRRGTYFDRDRRAQWQETPQHDVHITRGFWIDRCEVSNAAFARFVSEGGYRRRELWSDDGWAWKRDRVAAEPLRSEFAAAQQPRVSLSWYEADAYARWRGGRLPTEAEWEYAARGPAASLYPWGEAWDATRLNSQECAVNRTVAVDQYSIGKSWCGALQMAGNVWEWSADWYDEQLYRHAVRDNPQAPSTGKRRCIRGGSWSSPRSSTRSARRSSNPPAQQALTIGLRVVTDGE